MLVVVRQRVTVRAQETNFLGPISCSVAGDVVDVQWHTSRSWVDLVPPACLTLLSAQKDQDFAHMPVGFTVSCCAG